MKVTSSQLIKRFYETRGWEIHPFQQAIWDAQKKGHDGLACVATGFGKTYGATLQTLADMSVEKHKGIGILYLTPLRALAADIVRSLKVPLEEFGGDGRVDSRTGDTTASERTKQKTKPGQVLVTTPESLSVMLASPEHQKNFESLRLVVVDEWHELLGSKRGVQTQLVMTRLKALSPRLLVWGLSATIGNPEEALQILTPSPDRTLVMGTHGKEIDVECLTPENVHEFPWAGHMGAAMVPRVLQHLDLSVSNLIFTNTRRQAENWFQQILAAKPEWEDIIGLHHSALGREERTRVEEGIKDGVLKLVVCTSGLDLGVDFPKVERVYQVGSPKWIARFIQRAGRAGHTPEGVPRITFVPTHALEMFEYLAFERALAQGLRESITSPVHSWDVLAQHLVTLAAAEGINLDDVFQEVLGAYAFHDMTREQFDQVIDFLHTGGRSLSAYPAYKKLQQHKDRWLISTKEMLRTHMQNIGTITEAPLMKVQYVNGGYIGGLEEDFVAKLRKGDTFVFSGRVLQYVMIKNMTLYVRKSTKKDATIPAWNGGRLPMSALLAKELRDVWGLMGQRALSTPLTELLNPILEAQEKLSRVPAPDFLLVEECVTREGRHFFIFPFEGWVVHEGLAALLAVRLASFTKLTLTFSVSEYGIEILTSSEFSFSAEQIRQALSPANLSQDIQRSLNMTELAKRRFRDIAQIAGLINQNRQGDRRTVKNLQMSSSLLYEVFEKWDPAQLVYQQSHQEVRSQSFLESRLRSALERLQTLPLDVRTTPHPSPLAFPLIVERVASRVSTESLQDQLQRMKARWTRA